MKGRAAKILILVCLLLFVSLCQRGGGSRSSSSSRSSRSYSSSYNSRRRRYSSSGSGYSFWGWGSTNETVNNGTLSDDGSDEESGSGWKWIVGFLGAFGVLAYFGNNSQKKKQQQRRLKVNKMFDNFQAQAEANMCTLNDTEKANAKDWFMSTKWNILFQTINGSFRDTAVVTLADIKVKSSYSYKFNMTMKDSIGDSKAEGILIHQADYFSIYFEKTYNDRTEAGQTGTFDLLIYQGVQQGNVFRGKWYYQGFQLSAQYSGTWEMIPT